MSRLVSAVLLAGFLAVGPPATSAAPEHRSAPVLHRVVWDAPAKNGIHLRSAEVDGSDERHVYDVPNGFTLEITLDRAGRRVAFAPCCKARFPLLVVVPVLGGKPQLPLADHHQFLYVGGIGWSPDGRRLVFEADSRTGRGKHAQTDTGLWTIRPNGTGLQHVYTYPRPANPQDLVLNLGLGWTPAGILFSDGKDLRIARNEHSRLVLGNVHEVQISGDGNHLTMVRGVKPPATYVYSRPDGTHRIRLYRDPADYSDNFEGLVIPSYDGKQLLVVRDSSQGYGYETVVWTLSDGLASAHVLPFVGGASNVAWN